MAQSRRPMKRREPVLVLQLRHGPVQVQEKFYDFGVTLECRVVERRLPSLVLRLVGGGVRVSNQSVTLMFVTLHRVP